ncbi:hypothetical protein CCAX7_65140 [Capsulimonas corticalis]|uniref:Uncharacterized protein n=1 Tax=Capsulimonas corticalis TaxID=2219043 RepID=A0A402CR47_9BACT|nr:ABC transporter permease [Capsulimonas corticalis]BDI34463.1 hypothetical protein CCAX7_65140 [Capsulimonas corticalis]
MSRSRGSGVRATLWKELRENARWALLAAAALLAGIAHEALESRGGVFYTLKDFLGVWTGVETAMAVTPMFVAAGIAFVQIFSEKRRDQWAFLIHRPASPTALFWGKAAAGLGLYFAATGGALLAVALWAATPGHLPAPFDIHLLAPGARSILGGVLVYFGALLTALRPARWYGSRILPLALAVFFAFVARDVSPLLFAIPGILLAVAAWGAFVSSGGDAPRPALGGIALSLVLYSAFLGLSAAGISATDSVYRSLHAQAAQSYEQYAVILPNHLVRCEYAPIAGSRTSYDLVGARGLDGHEYRFDSHMRVNGKPLSWPTTLETMDALPWAGETVQHVTPLNSYRELAPPFVCWYYVHSSRLIEIYALDSRRLLGRIGLNGYLPADQGRPAPFDDVPVMLPMDHNRVWADLYVFRSRIYRLISFDAMGRFLPIRERTFSLLHQEPPGAKIVYAAQMSQIDGNASLAYIVMTNRGIELLGGDGSLIYSLPWKPGQSAENTLVDVDIASQIDRGKPNPDHYFFWLRPYRTVARPTVMDVVEVSGEGKVLQQAQITRKASASPAADTPWFGAALPPFLAAAAAHLTSSGDTPAGPRIAISVAAAVIAAVLAWLTGIRRAETARVRAVWSVLCLVFGLPALMTLVAFKAWPARVICPACGKRRVVTHEHCEHCGAAFPPPTRDGTEIFEAPEAIAQVA